MHASAIFAVLSAFVAASSAATLYPRQYPDCANPCIANAQVGSCSSDDLNCLCNSTDFISSTTSCIISSCSADDAEKAEAVARQFCATVGVTLTSTPTLPTSSASSGASSGSASGTASATGAPSSVSTSASAPASSSTAPSGSTSSTGAQTTGTNNNGAASNGYNALLGLAAVGLVALNL